MTQFEDITAERKILEIPETATMESIKSSYRRLLAMWHPDKCAENQEERHERTRGIIWAYETLIDYCQNYQYVFSEEAVKRHRSPEDWWRDRFGDDPLWGNGEKPK